MDSFTACGCEHLLSCNPINLPRLEMGGLEMGGLEMGCPHLYVVSRSELVSPEWPPGGATMQLLPLIRVAGFLICRQFIFIQTKGDHVKNITSVDSL